MEDRDRLAAGIFGVGETQTRQVRRREAEPPRVEAAPNGQRGDCERGDRVEPGGRQADPAERPGCEPAGEEDRTPCRMSNFLPEEGEHVDDAVVRPLDPIDEAHTSRTGPDREAPRGAAEPCLERRAPDQAEDGCRVGRGQDSSQQESSQR